jgi:L-glutamine-phosphate cytidylyltransferase
MADLRAAILAAGRGVRMGGNVPKTLMPMGAHEPLLYYTIEGLKKSGVTDVLIVTGFKPEMVQQFVEKHSEGIQVSYVRNTRYASWGNFHSLRMAVDQSPGVNVLVVNSDVVVTPDVLRRVIEAEGDLLLAVERRRRLDDEDMRVELKGRSVQAIGKNLKLTRSHGEFVGVSKLSPDAAQRYASISTDWEWWATSQRTTRGYYEDVYAAMLGVVDARAVFVEPGEYAEVDTPDDAQAAQAVIAEHADAWAAPSRVE